mgnify:CR=1 FL=1
MEYQFSCLFSWTSGKPIIPSNGDIPIYGSNGIIGYTNDAKYENKIILGRVGAYCGSVAYCPGRFNATDNTLITSCVENKITTHYAYYLLKSLNLNSFAGGAAQPLITQSILKRLKCDIPSLNVQRRIASILSTYDTLIENNTKRIRLLEKMAENLYKEWFVRFRFPGHEKVEMENGLPKGWTVEKVKDWCRVFTGRKDVNQTKEDGQYVFFSCSPNTFHSDEFIYDGKAILVAGNGSYTGRTRYFEGKFDLYQRTYAVVSNKEDDSFMFYLYLRFKFDFEPMHSGGTRGSAIPYIVMKDLTKYKFLYKEDIVEEYIKKVKPMFAEIDNLQQQNILLARQRDLLLPRLMSGKLEV